jgi:hypothetical protein
MVENPNPYESPKARTPVARPQLDAWDWMILAGAVWLFFCALGVLGILGLLISWRLGYGGPLGD